MIEYTSFSLRLVSSLLGGGVVDRAIRFAVVVGWVRAMETGWETTNVRLSNPLCLDVLRRRVGRLCAWSMDPGSGVD